MSSTGCPKPEELRDFNRGKLSLAAVEELAPHIESCESCQTILSSLVAETGSVFERLRAEGLISRLETSSSSKQPKGPATLLSAVHRPPSEIDSRSGHDDTQRPGPPSASDLSPIMAGMVKRIGQYELLEEIGRGGMGVVFKARHARMERVVALKILPLPAKHRADLVERFRREIKAAARLMHPNVVVAHDADEADGVHFLVMEYVDGCDLSTLVKRHGPLTVERAIHFTLQAAHGLAAAHAEGIVHRDIKPGNLLVDKRDHVKILDLGLAHLDAPQDAASEPAEGDLTTSGLIMGTIDYMAPEQAFDCKHADARADIYSLGCTLHYLLTGKPPFREATQMARLLAHREQPIPRLSESLGDIPEIVEQAFEKMLAKKLEDRYQSMAEVIEDLQCCPGGAVQSIAGSFATQLDNGNLRFLATQTSRTVVSRTGIATNPQDRALARSKTWRWGLAACGLTLIVAAVLGIVYFKGPGAEEPAIPAISSTDRPPESPPPNVELPTASPAPAADNFAPFNTEQLVEQQKQWAERLGTGVEWPNSLGMRLRLIPPGDFLMGSTEAEIEQAIGMASGQGEGVFAAIRNEAPQHRVKLTKPFAIGVTEVTYAQFQTFVEAANYVTDKERIVSKSKDSNNWRSPGYPVTPDMPVNFVTWNDAVTFCDWLTAQERAAPTAASLSGVYRLPTEAEWEYVCRAGTPSHYSFGDSFQLRNFAWNVTNSGGKPHAVAGKQQNPLGLFDLYGNVHEMCADAYRPYEPSADILNDPLVAQESRGTQLRALRGGAASSQAVGCRSAYRHQSSNSVSTYTTGFRIVRTLQSSERDQPEPQESERDVAAWVLRKGGKVSVVNRSSRKFQELTQPDQLPHDPFDVTSVKLDQQKGLVRDDFKRLAQLPNLKLLAVWGTTGVDDETIKHFKGLFQLQQLFLGETKVSAAGLQELRDLKKLSRLDLQNLNIGDGDLALLKNFPELRVLGLRGTPITEASLSELAQLTQLTDLDVRLTCWTSLTIPRLQAALPGCKLRSRPANLIEPGQLTTARKWQAEWSKYLGIVLPEKDALGMTMTLVPPGEFSMGSTPEQIAVVVNWSSGTPSAASAERRLAAESPQHQVTLTRPLLFSATEVTIGQFRKFVAAEKYVTETERLGGGMRFDEQTRTLVVDPTLTWRTPRHGVSDESPVSQVTWNDAAAFCVWASREAKLEPPYKLNPDGTYTPLSGNGYRLPTEAQWEYGCRAGATTLFSHGDDVAGLDAVAWHRGNAQQQAHPVAKLKANNFSLYDMLGGVHEWCQDWFDAKWYEQSPASDPQGPATGAMRVVRGGSQDDTAEHVRCASRRSISDLKFRHPSIGFRVVRVLELPPKASGD